MVWFSDVVWALLLKKIWNYCCRIWGLFNFVRVQGDKKFKFWVPNHQAAWTDADHLSPSLSLSVYRLRRRKTSMCFFLKFLQGRRCLVNLDETVCFSTRSSSGSLSVNTMDGWRWQIVNCRWKLDRNPSLFAFSLRSLRFSLFLLLSLFCGCTPTSKFETFWDVLSKCGGSKDTLRWFGYDICVNDQKLQFILGDETS